MFYWWTVSLCHIEANHVTTAGLCVSLFSYQRQRFLVLFRLLYVGWFVLPTIYEEMWTEILTEIKKTLWKATFRLRRWLLSPCCSAPCILTHIADTVYHAVCIRLVGVTWTWHWLRRHLSILAVCVRVYVCTCMCVCVNGNIGGRESESHYLAESTGVEMGSSLWLQKLHMQHAKFF